jgi:hypothetical protein
VKVEISRELKMVKGENGKLKKAFLTAKYAKYANGENFP